MDGRRVIAAYGGNRMKKNHKRIAILAVLGLSLALLTACTAGTTTPSAAPADTAAAQATAAPAADVATAQPAADATTAAPAETVALTVYTAETLAKFDGQNGNPAYVAVDGKVYDVSAVPQWRNGSHAGGSVKAGLDQTEALKRSPHGAKNLENLPIVGLYQ